MPVIRNPDENFVKNLRRRIRRNNGYCPCKLEKKPDNKCPCRDFREGRGCDCGYYIEVKEGDGAC